MNKINNASNLNFKSLKNIHCHRGGFISKCSFNEETIANELKKK